MVSGANLSVDQLNFNVSGFRSAGPNPAAAGGLIQTGNGFTGTSTLLHAGNASLNASAVVALETASQYNYDGLATGTGSHVMSAGQNIIRDTNALDSTAAAVATHIYGALTTSITYSTAPGTSAAGTFLVAYQATDGVHIAEAYVVATTGSTNHNTFVTPGVIGNVHDIIDLVGTTLSTFSSAHIAFT
jgi:hypothetical protein